MRYLLPCEQCGEKTAIDASQAGRQINCPCGAALVVPSFRAIRELERADDTPTAPRRRGWNPVRGATFAAGLLTIILGVLLATAAGVAWVKTDTTQQEFGDLRQAEAEMEKLPATKVLDIWSEMRESGLGPYILPRHLWAEQWVSRCRWSVIVGLLVVAFGAAMCAGPVLVSKLRR